MTLPDVNVLVQAFRSDTSEHVRCRRWLLGVVNGDARFGLSPQVLSGVLRVVTHPRVFVEPSARDEAVRFCDVLIRDPKSTLIRPGERHWDIFARIVEQSDARGNLIPDAWFAAMAMESGCEWITLDRDYARFPGLRWRLPD